MFSFFLSLAVQVSLLHHCSALQLHLAVRRQWAQSDLLTCFPKFDGDFFVFMHVLVKQVQRYWILEVTSLNIFNRIIFRNVDFIAWSLKTWRALKHNMINNQ